MRREILSAMTGASMAFLAGCVGALDDDDADVEIPELPLIEEPPDAVYIPTHREGMMPDPVAVGEPMVGPMVTYPHPFWLVSGEGVELVEVTANRHKERIDHPNIVRHATGLNVRGRIGVGAFDSHTNTNFRDRTSPSVWTVISRMNAFETDRGSSRSQDETPSNPVDLRFARRLERLCG